MRWRPYVVVKITEYNVSSHAPLALCQPDPRNVETPVVSAEVLSRHFTRNASTKMATRFRKAYVYSGWIGGYRIEAWDQDELQDFLKQRHDLGDYTYYNFA